MHFIRQLQQKCIVCLIEFLSYQYILVRQDIFHCFSEFYPFCFFSCQKGQFWYYIYCFLIWIIFRKKIIKMGQALNGGIALEGLFYILYSSVYIKSKHLLKWELTPSEFGKGILRPHYIFWIVILLFQHLLGILLVK